MVNWAYEILTLPVQRSILFESSRVDKHVVGVPHAEVHQPPEARLRAHQDPAHRGKPS